MSKSPIFVAFGAALNGLETIRAFIKQRQTMEVFEASYLEANMRAWYHWLLVNRWVGFRLDMLSFLLLMAIVMLGVSLAFSTTEIDPGLLAIAITYAIQLSGVFQYTVRLSAKCETMMTSAERILFYASLPSEPNHSDAESTLPVVASTNGGEQKQIISEPHISFRDVYVRYRHDLPMILCGISFDISRGEKIGIVGRTGSGKSSLALSLLRLNDVYKGSIFMGGVDTSKLSLASLRKRIGVVPQEPILFTGSLRHNLDPTGTRADSDLWAALDAVGMRSLAQDSPEEPATLDKFVQERGSNFSVGERQCLSMARALLEESDLYIMDEATANIDQDSDAKIQTLLRTSNVFSHATIITIAHRISTIEDSSRIIVLEAGRIVEMGTPEELRALGGHFSKIATK